MMAKISDIANLNLKNYKFSKENEIIKYLDTSSVDKGVILGFQVLQTCKDDVPSRAKRSVKDGTIIISTVRPSLLHYAYLDNPDKNVVVSTGYLTIDAKPAIIDSKYLYCVLTSSFVTNYLINISSTAVSSYPSFNPDDLGNLVIDFPDNINEQKKIAKQIFSLNSKITNNNKINAELESMAKTLYDYWFLQFEFPNEEGKPYKSSGGKMVYNEELKKEIPESWEVKNIKELCDITWGQCPDGNNILPLNSEEDSILYCSGAGDMRNGLLVDCQARTNASRRYANKNDVLMSVAGSIGAFAIVDEKISLGRAAMAFTSKKCSTLFTYITVKTLVERMKQVASGSIQKVINDNHISEMNVPYNKKVFELFDKYNTILNEQIGLSKENKILSSLRDFLLPLLMNGQVTFKDC